MAVLTPDTRETEATGPVARVRAHSRSFGDTHVLRSIDLDIRDGELIALLAAAGAASRRCCAAWPASTRSRPGRSRSPVAPASRSRSPGSGQLAHRAPERGARAAELPGAQAALRARRGRARRGEA